MIRTALYLMMIGIVILTACHRKLVNIQDLTPEERTSTYQLMKDIPYGPDAEQNMDIYLSGRASKYGKRNFTVVFLHGGGYYLSDKSQEEAFILPYLAKGLNVVNLNYRLKRGIPLAMTDLTQALNFLKANNSDYDLNLNNVILTGFSAGAHIATNIGLSQNNPAYPNPLDEGITIGGIINFSGPVDALDVVERIFTDSDFELFRDIGKALFPSEDYEAKEKIEVYEPITYFDKNDPPIFLWHGGMDNQIPPETFLKFISLMDKNKDIVIYKSDGGHSPNEAEFQDAYAEIFAFLDNL